MTNKFFIKINLKTYKMNYLKLMFIMIMIMSTMITLNSSSWLNSWMGLEINLMSFLPLMMNFSKSIKLSNSMMIYFMIQASASSILLMMILLMKMELIINNFWLLNILQLSILMKLGASPFHWWITKVTLNIDWINMFLLLTWQKIAPLFILLMINFNSMIYIFSLFSVISGAILGLNQSMIKLMLTYSSINQLGWMLMILNLNLMLLIIYLIIYSLINLMICLNFKLNNLVYLNQLIKNNNFNIYNKIICLSLFLSLAGLPPLLGFLPKLFSLIIMIKNNLIFESFLFSIMSIISLSFYMNPLMSMMLINKINNKWKLNNFYLNIIMINLLMSLIIFILFMFYFF
uniref:NADH-ubiquinone oxidoreductase chain 2 n=1 Tax=Neostromboceros nipponicus TaxID=2805799 RepID=A0A8A6C318_9HYME|nr:NADH dehydrogenase subunit 2 [Neostromboceros nipponicus]QTH79147.1 NADH dehydrogenase subunit 2 [Neostromboceros nipponicus]